MGKTIEARSEERRVRELETDEEDSDNQGGLVLRSGTRFASDSLQFTGTDLGDRSGALRQRMGHGGSGSEDDASDSDGPDIDEMDLALMSSMEKEEFLYQSAMARIQRARERGLTDVNLSKLELDALEKRREREAEEAERRARRKRRDQRVAIPLTQLDPVSKKRPGSKSQLSSRHQSATDLTDAGELRALPPVGHFPPPANSRARPRSGTASSQRPLTIGYDDQYEHSELPGSRQASDSLSRSRSSKYYDDGAASSSSGSRTLDPFKFQTAGPRASRSSGAAAASKRHTMPPESPYRTRSGRTRGAVQRTPSSGETSEEGNAASDESTDDYDSGARVKQSPPARQEAIVVEDSPEPEPAKKKSPSPTKRKPVASRVRRGKKK
uniref:Prenylated Rab acceptor 1 n=3 Tax=Bionectria ochroleuca TaxID=29856 RepID=A0A0B7JP67_BIOOC